MNAHCSLEALSSYVDDELNEREVEVVRAHVAGCPQCRRQLAGLRGVVDRLQRLEEVAAPSTLDFQVERRLRLEGDHRPLSQRLEGGLGRFARQPVLAPLFAVVIAFGAILYLFSLGVERNERAGTRVVVGGRTPSEEAAQRESSVGGESVSHSGASAGDGSEASGAMIDRAGFRFTWDSGVWVAAGIKDGPADAVIDLGAGDGLPPGIEELGEYPGIYRLRLEGRVLEIVVPESGDR